MKSLKIPTAGEENRVVAVLSLTAGLSLLALALFLLAPLAPAKVDLADVNRVLAVVQPQDLNPEPLERFLYIIGVLLLPFSLGIAYVGVRRFQKHPAGRRLIGRLASPLSWSLAPLVLALVLAAGFADDRGVVLTLVPGGAISLLAAVAIVAGIAAANGRFFRMTDRAQHFLLRGLAGLLLLGVLSFTILGPEHIRNAPIFWASFNAVFYSVVQVFFGKELLVDFSNQYGLYPHFIEPVFRLVGLSLYSFTALMGLLSCLAFACLYCFLARETADELLAFLGLTTIVFFGYVSGRVASQDLVLQYHPIRIIFPAIFLMVARAYAHGPTPRLGVLLPALGAASLLWNPDSGTIVFLAGLLLLAYDALLRRRPQDIPARLLLGLLAAAAVIASFSVFMRVRFGAFPDYTRLLVHTKTYYGYGVSMLPMPHFGLWVPVLVVYAVALLLSVAALVDGDDTPRARIFFFLSVLGLGLFTYYQGRSHLGNLMGAGYPAVIIAVLLASDLRRRTLPRPPAADRLLSVTLLVLLCYSVPALATVAPAWARGIAEKIRVTRSGKAGEVLREAGFLRHYLHPGQEVVIVSYNSGFHHLLTQTTNPLDIPGDTEMLYRSDKVKQNDYILSGRGTFVIDKNTVTADSVAVALRANKISYDNGSLVVFPSSRGTPGR